MRVLLDNNVNQDFARLLTGHEVTHARDLGWGELQNGNLIAQAESHGFDALVTVDKQMRHQQHIQSRHLCVLVLNCVLLKWSHIAPLAPKVQAMLDENGLVPGTFILIVPDPPS